jgi:hypothetical protein
VCAADADWTILLEPSGAVQYSYEGTPVATRATGPDDDPCGLLTSTPEGEALNPQFPEQEEGVPPEENPFGLLELSFGWAGAPDLDIGVSFLGGVVGFGYPPLAPYVTWSGDNTTTGGPETVTVDLAQAWDDGEIATFADVLAMADWYPSAGGSGPATLTVIYDGGAPVTYTLHPGVATPAVSSALAIRINEDGSYGSVGTDWSATVRAIRRPPVECVIYIEVTESSGAVTAVEGPFLAATLPAPSGGTVPFPLASSDGAGGLKQHHTGPLVWI